MALDAGREHGCFAAHPRQSRGRLHNEPESATRNAFRRDCDRIIHSTAFRRLKHKTQVFVFHEGDHYRTRLTHTLEVTQIARSLARALGLDEDLAEASALAHDLGHPPFGHAGERALDACLSELGGFDHNAQTLRVVTLIERRYAEFDGLNLTFETLEGIVKHNGPMTDRNGKGIGRYRDSGAPLSVADYVKRHDLELWTHSSAESQAAAIADDIAYDTHDIDDGLRAGLFELSNLREVPLIEGIFQEISARFPGLEEPRMIGELLRRLITAMIEDVVAETERRVKALRPRSPDDVRHAGHALVGFSPTMEMADRAIKQFLFDHMYRHPRITRIMAEAESRVSDLFRQFRAHPETLPAEWRHVFDAEGSRARQIADYIAGMTDRYALIEHARYFDSTPELS